MLYSGLEITRLELDNKIKYKKDDYRQLEESSFSKRCKKFNTPQMPYLSAFAAFCQKLK